MLNKQFMSTESEGDIRTPSPNPQSPTVQEHWTENCLNSYVYGNHLQQWKPIPDPRLHSRDSEPVWQVEGLRWEMD